MMNKPIMNPYILVGIGVISVSTSAIFVKLSTAPSGVIAFYRLFFSVLILLPIFLYNHLHEVRKMTKKDLYYSFLAGFLLAFHFILWFESLNYTSVASSTVLVTLQPLFSFFGTYFFFKEQISKKTLISGLIAIIGSFIIGWGDFQYKGQALYGDFLALVACALITGYLLVGQAVRKRISNVSYTFVIYSMSSITILLYVFFKGEPLFPYSMENWIYFLLLAILPTLLGHSIFNWSLKWISTNFISMAILFEPIGSSILAFIILDERLMCTQWIGGLLVILGLFIYTMNPKNRSL